MRKAFGSSLIVILFLALSLGVSVQVHGEGVSHLVEVHHNIEVMEGGLILVNDTFTLSNPPNATSELENLFVGFHSYFIDRIDYSAFYLWEEDTWITLSSELGEADEEDIRGFIVTMPRPMRLEEGKTLTLRGVFLFSKMVNIYGGFMYASFPIYPSLPINISTCEVEVRLPKGAILGGVDPAVFSNTTIDGVYILSHTGISVPRFNKEVAAVMYQAGTSSNLLVECESVTRVIDLKHPSRVRIRDTYTLHNLGSLISFYVIRVPLDSFDIRARDGLGLLSFMSESDEEGYIRVYIIARIGIQTGETWTFTVEHSLPFKGYVERNEGGRLDLNYFLLSNFSFTVRHLEATVALPEGGEYLNSTPAHWTVRRVGPFAQEPSYSMENATILDDLGFCLAYRYNPLWAAFRPTLWSSLLVLTVVGFRQLLRFRRRPEEREVPEDRRLIRRFIELYEEKLSLSAEGERLEEDVENRRISRSKYDQRMRVIKSRSSRAEDLLRGIKDRIKRGMPQFGDVLREIEVAEVEVETERTSLRELQGRLRGRRISREAYRRLRREYLRRIRRARSRIERAILSLRERLG